MRKHKIVLDTDIGTDVDDAMALALLLGRADVEILGITTVYGDTKLRSQIAARYARLMGAKLKIHAGSEQTLSGRHGYLDLKALFLQTSQMRTSKNLMGLIF